MPVRYRALRDACEVQGFERCLWGTGLFIFHVASLCRVIKCDKEVTFHIVRPCQEWEINKLIHGVFKFKWNLTYSRQVSRAGPNDSGHKIHVGCYSHTRSLITGLGRSFLRQAGVEFAQITLFTRSMLAIYTATQGAWSQVLGSSPSRSQKSVQIVNKEVITTQPHNFFRSMLILTQFHRFFLSVEFWKLDWVFGERKDEW